jgi:hypothetical protein
MKLSSQVIRTLGDVMRFVMAPSAGGTVPGEQEEEYAQWRSGMQQKQEEYAVRAFWRRLLTQEEITISGDTTLLPKRFHKPNGLYLLTVEDSNGDVVDYTDPDDPLVTVEMINDPDAVDGDNNPTIGRWQMRFKETQPTLTAKMWYFAAPPVPEAETDIVLLPGDMVGFAALGEYFRTAGEDGSQDKSEQDAENRFQEYITLEAIPAKSELIRVSQKRTNRVGYLKQFYYRRNRFFRGA